MTTRPPAPLDGFADPAFRDLADVFAQSVASGVERGGLAVRIGGKTVLDLHGGLADPAIGRPWCPDTLVCCFSVTKGVLSLVAHQLIDAGTLDPEAPVASYWPEFAAAGNGGITVMDVLTHRAGLPAVSGAVARGDLYDWNRMVAHLAASAPVVPPGEEPVYHNMTYGYLLGEVLCRASRIRPLSTLITRRIASPLGADFRLGLEAGDIARTALLRQADSGALFRALEAEPNGLFARSMAFFGRDEDFNSDRWRMAQIGSGSGHATALGIALIYEQFVVLGGLLSQGRQKYLRMERARSAGSDAILGVPIRYGEGVELSLPPGIDFGPRTSTLGYWGAGGATGFADPDAALAFGYVTGEMEPGLGSSPRARTLIAALYRCL